ncbi:MAG: hypothetical protein HYS13_26150 [Planctomycetia bacterium]|nr:hypothetical protein [Planctomycetia bacterium]
MKPPDVKTWRWKFSLAALLLSVTFLAVMFAALRSSSPLWSSVISTAAVTVLVFAFLGALVTRKETRSFCVGFAFLGWVYLLLMYGPWFGENVAPHMLSTQGLGFAYEKLFGTEAPNTVGRQFGLTFADFDTDGSGDIVLTNGSRLYRNAAAPAPATLPTHGDFSRIGHCGLALILAVAGGVLARAVYRNREAEGEEK